MLGSAVVSHQDRVSEVLQAGIVRMSIIPHLAVLYLRILHAAIIQKLFDLMAADITENPSVFLLFKEPVRSALRIPNPVRPEAIHMDRPADSALFNQRSRENSRF